MKREFEAISGILLYGGISKFKGMRYVVGHLGTVDVVWGQPIKLVQAASTSELCENRQNNLLFFEIVPCHFCGASEVQT